MVATVLARSAGARKVTGVTSVPSPTLEVVPARKPIVVVLSGRSSHTLPYLGDLQEVVHEPQAVEPGLFGGDRYGCEALGKRRCTAVPGEPGDLQSEPERPRILGLAARRFVRRPEPRQHQPDRAGGEQAIP